MNRSVGLLVQRFGVCFGPPRVHRGAFCRSACLVRARSTLCVGSVMRMYIAAARGRRGIQVPGWPARRSVDSVLIRGWFGGVEAGRLR
jgi:hypothetical protein